MTGPRFTEKEQTDNVILLCFIAPGFLRNLLDCVTLLWHMPKVWEHTMSFFNLLDFTERQEYKENLYYFSLQRSLRWLPCLLCSAREYHQMIWVPGKKMSNEHTALLD